MYIVVGVTEGFAQMQNNTAAQKPPWQKCWLRRRAGKREDQECSAAGKPSVGMRPFHFDGDGLGKY